MGEIAEMMLDGTLCASCGVPLVGPDDEPQGFPGYCSRQCERDSGMPYQPPIARSKSNARKAARNNREREIAAGGIKQFACHACTKRFRSATDVEDEKLHCWKLIGARGTST